MSIETKEERILRYKKTDAKRRIREQQLRNFYGQRYGGCEGCGQLRKPRR